MQSRFSQFDNLISSIYRSIQKIKSTEMETLGLKGSQVKFLYYLYLGDKGLNATQMSQVCDEDKAAISRTIKELENGGYIFIEEQEGKRYKNLIKLTNKGNEVGKFISDKIDNYYLIGNSGIKDNERDRFYVQLNLIAENLQNIIKNLGGKNGN